jgi:hypothetical protein
VASIRETRGPDLILVGRYDWTGAYEGIVEDVEGRAVYGVRLRGKGCKARCLERCREWAGEQIDAAEAGSGAEL